MYLEHGHCIVGFYNNFDEKDLLIENIENENICGSTHIQLFKFCPECGCNLDLDIIRKPTGITVIRRK